MFWTVRCEYLTERSHTRSVNCSKIMAVFLEVLKLFKMTNVILASQSPRRKELLRAMGVEFEVVPSSFEEVLDDDRDPELVAIELALGKALNVAKDYSDSIVIGSDTIVTIDGAQLEKPMSKDDAFDMLKRLAGKTNYVSTSVAVVCIAKNIRLTAVETVPVHLAPFDEELTKAYVATGDPMDKAGGYSIQKLESSLVDRIEGNYDTVTGLPTSLLAKLLEQCGVSARGLNQQEARSATAESDE